MAAAESEQALKAPRPSTYQQIVQEAVRDFQRAASPQDMVGIVERLKRAAEGLFKPIEQVRRDVHRHYDGIYTRVTRKPRGHRAIPRFTRENMTAEAREELNSKLISSMELIRLNRQVAIAKTAQRMVGWLSSVTPEGVETKGATKQITKALKQLPYEERRVIIDQGHKLVASLEDVVNRGSGAIAAIWHSHVHQAGYDYREEHAKRDGNIYILRGSWADKEGLVKALKGYTDQQTQPAQEINCRCYFQYLYNLQDLPEDMLTQKAKDILSGKLKYDAA